MNDRLRIVELMRHMAKWSDEISDIVAEGSEYYFRYKGHVFSLVRKQQGGDDPEYDFYVYPDGNHTTSIPGLIERLNTFDAYETPMKAYSSTDYGDGAFKDLYDAIENKALKIDDIIDDILGK